MGIVLVALNLRPVFSSLSVIMPELRADTGLSATQASLLTTLPVLCLGLFAPLAPRLAHRFGMERVLLGVVLLVALGTGLRAIDRLSTLYLGTAIAGLSIAIGNVLLPALVKRDFPKHTALLTGFYSMALCGGAAVAAALTLPMEKVLSGDWHGALGLWSVPALFAACVWTAQIARSRQHFVSVRPPVSGLWLDPLAWQVTLFMGLQSAFAYSIFGWLAPILRLRGIDGVSAGYIVSSSVMAQVVASLFVPSLGARSQDQRIINIVLASMAFGGLMAMMFAPVHTVWLWSIILGVGQGGLFAIAMTMIVLRSGSPVIASQLSSMAQGVGYTLAAIAPLIIGLLLDRSDSLVGPAIMFFVLFVALCLAGLGAGRALFVQAREDVAVHGAHR